MAAFTTDMTGYMAATVFYSLVTALVVEALIRIWSIHRPSTRFKFRLLVLFLPLLYWPAFLLAFPQRQGDVFRQGAALLNLKQWLDLPVAGTMPFRYGLLLLLASTTLLFLAQELAPTLHTCLARRHRQESRRMEKGQHPGLHAALAEVSQKMGRPAPPVLVADRQAPAVYVAGAANPTLVISSHLLEALDGDELRGVLAHELAHLRRRDSWWGWALLVIRVLMFYNPVALLVSRQLVQDNEQACDDVAVSATGQPLAFAAGLIKAFQAEKPESPAKAQGRSGNLRSRASAMYDHASLATVKKRVARLLNPPPVEDSPYENIRLVVVSSMLAVLLFFVV
ncbi:MAG: M56 family metallopeptidase [Dehalococcoidia bacterium]|nr:M56 family metallopeptidase [Dehalococcoidia bacterium]